MTFDEWFNDVFKSTVKTQQEKEYLNKMRIILHRCWSVSRQIAKRQRTEEIVEIIKNCVVSASIINGKETDQKYKFIEIRAIDEIKQKYLEGE